MKTTNVIFLDFDGPLTNRRAYYAYDKPKNRHMWTTADPVAIGMINNLCERFHAKIVLSTSWRKFGNKTPTKFSAKKSLIEWGFTGEFHNVIHTPVLNGLCPMRWDEIMEWLKLNGDTVNHFCSIDDDLKQLEHSFVNPVQVDPDDGFCSQNYVNAIAYLEGRLGASTVKEALVCYDEFNKRENEFLVKEAKELAKELEYARNADSKETNSPYINK